MIFAGFQCVLHDFAIIFVPLCPKFDYSKITYSKSCMAKNILSLTSQEAFDFLMKSEQYHSFELPEYFCFDEVLKFVRDNIGSKSYEEYLGGQLPDDLDKVADCHYALPVISRMIDPLEDMQEKQDCIDKVYNKLCKQPNSDYNQLWLQNMTYTRDKKNGRSPYKLRLCQLVSGKEVEQIWNNDWLKAEITSDIPYNSVVNEETLKKETPVITF